MTFIGESRFCVILHVSVVNVVITHAFVGDGVVGGANPSIYPVAKA